MNEPHGDPTPVIGGCEIPARLIDAPPPYGSVPDDQLGRQLFMLLSLHPEIQPQFQGCDLNSMDGAAKEAMLRDIQCLLGIRGAGTPAR